MLHSPFALRSSFRQLFSHTVNRISLNGRSPCTHVALFQELISNRSLDSVRGLDSSHELDMKSCGTLPRTCLRPWSNETVSAYRVSIITMLPAGGSKAYRRTSAFICGELFGKVYFPPSAQLFSQVYDMASGNPHSLDPLPPPSLTSGHCR